MSVYSVVINIFVSEVDGLVGTTRNHLDSSCGTQEMEVYFQRSFSTSDTTGCLGEMSEKKAGM